MKSRGVTGFFLGCCSFLFLVFLGHNFPYFLQDFLFGVLVDFFPEITILHHSLAEHFLGHLVLNAKVGMVTGKVLAWRCRGTGSNFKWQ